PSVGRGRFQMTEPRTQHDYGEREVAAARRVLIDLGQVLGAYLMEGVVVVGGWVPDLLIVGAEERHVGSIDVDLALDVEKLREGRYAEIVNAMLATGRYEKTDKDFKLRAKVDLGDSGPVVFVDVDFLKPVGKVKRGGKPRLLEDFRALDAEGCVRHLLLPGQRARRNRRDGASVAGVAGRRDHRRRNRAPARQVLIRRFLWPYAGRCFLRRLINRGTADASAPCLRTRDPVPRARRVLTRDLFAS